MREELPARINAELFVAEFLSNGRNATEAYAKLRPEVTHKSACCMGSAMLREPRVQALLEERIGEAMKKYSVTPERIIQELACMAFLDVDDLYHDDGTLKRLSEIPEESRRAIVGLESKLNQFGGTTTAKLESKRAALELLGKHLAMWTDVHRNEGNDELVNAILGARKRVKKITTVEEEDVFN